MANHDISESTGIVDKRRGRGSTGVSTMAEINNTTSISALRTRLAALNAGYFTAARLDTMTKNDMLYALRVGSADAAGI